MYVYKGMYLCAPVLHPWAGYGPVPRPLRDLGSMYHARCASNSTVLRVYSAHYTCTLI
jgi:hypothetical protein